jgi:hypothetical protein
MLSHSKDTYNFHVSLSIVNKDGTIEITINHPYDLFIIIEDSFNIINLRHEFVSYSHDKMFQL